MTRELMGGDNHGIPKVTVLHGHTTMETAHVTDDYPYGRVLRCQRREWLEYKPRFGYRLVTQTTDPRREGVVWNKPHPGGYSDWAVMTQDPNEGETFGHIGWVGLSLNGPTPAEHVRFALSGLLDQLDLKETGMYRGLLMVSRKYAAPWDRWRETIQRMRDGALTKAEFPTAGELTKDGHYVDQRDWEAARAQIITAYDAWAPFLPVVIKRDGKAVAFVKEGNAAYKWFHTHHCYSLDHGVKYEGYEVKGLES